MPCVSQAYYAGVLPVAAVLDVNRRKAVHRYPYITPVLANTFSITLPSLFIGGWRLVSAQIIGDVFL
jgi:hypothetical protein